MPAENIVHYGAIRLRVVGTGNLIPTFQSMDNINTSQLVAIPMTATNAREPLRLSNFISQRAKLQVKTTVINEKFTINRIIVFIKPIYTDFPA